MLGTGPGVGDLPSSGNRGTGPSLPAQSGREAHTHWKGIGCALEGATCCGLSNPESRLGESPVGLLRGSVGPGVGWNGEGARFSGGEPEC